MKRWLHTAPLAVLAMVLACVPAGAQQTAANPADVASPEAMLTAMYDVISGPAGQERDWNRFRSLFLPGARLVWSQTTQAGGEQLHALTVEEFVQRVTPVYASGGGFWERDIGHRLERYGNMAQIFTAYETRRSAPDGPVTARGINSVQLMHHQGRWWVVNVAWDTERPGNPIPAEILQRQ